MDSVIGILARTSLMIRDFYSELDIDLLDKAGLLSKFNSSSDEDPVQENNNRLDRSVWRCFPKGH